MARRIAFLVLASGLSLSFGGCGDGNRAPPVSAAPAPDSDAKPQEVAAPTTTTSNTPSGSQFKESDAEALATSLQQWGIKLAMYDRLSGRIELEKGALDDAGRFSPDALELLKQLDVPGMSISF